MNFFASVAPHNVKIFKNQARLRRKWSCVASVPKVPWFSASESLFFTLLRLTLWNQKPMYVSRLTKFGIGYSGRDEGSPPPVQHAIAAGPSSELRRPFLIIFWLKWSSWFEIRSQFFFGFFPRGIPEIQLDLDSSIDFLAVLEPLDGEVGDDWPPKNYAQSREKPCAPTLCYFISGVVVPNPSIGSLQYQDLIVFI